MFVCLFIGSLFEGCWRPPSFVMELYLLQFWKTKLLALSDLKLDATLQSGGAGITDKGLDDATVRSGKCLTAVLGGEYGLRKLVNLGIPSDKMKKKKSPEVIVGRMTANLKRVWVLQKFCTPFYR
ncbi:uncharacterized protein PGTG_12966 [Puccinia graminis f. sp. tritici CRL 75-36-700-3]|uniref:Uncharacterized protein n=1 Tax=Puccinia graminis f. sp. tritici (strain CRL 75-36-700-3 / race SCCL) TaxID=418459 RepID=E3KQK9_PUCGT|nr:uncharacterized protein PGTG_12966 [Puccinia graminis f. sp. tritici CRL 75-36-700-3]EFP86584.2 hypothetical protein PGTG_12966 [Puccinia graminis f. sp. tritici CRL 75-36-700-3]